MFCVCGSLVLCKAKRLTIIALSPHEAELMSASEACRQTVWLRSLLGEILDNGKFTVEEKNIRHSRVSLRCNNQGALQARLLHEVCMRGNLCRMLMRNANILTL